VCKVFTLTKTAIRFRRNQKDALDRPAARQDDKAFRVVSPLDELYPQQRHFAIAASPWFRVVVATETKEALLDAGVETAIVR
jgi:hypothetical protein